MAELTLLLTGAVHGTVETALSPVRKRHIFDYYSDMVGEYVCADEKYTVNLMVDGELCSDFSLYLNNEQNELPASGAIFSECYGLARLRVKLGDVRYETGSFGVLTGAGADGHEVRSMAEYTLRYISACRPPSDGRNASEELLSALCSSYEGLLRSVRMSPYRSGGPVHHPVSVPVTAPGPYRDPLTCPKELSLSVGCLRRLIITLTALRQRMSLEYVRLSFDAGNEAYMDSAWHLGRLIKESLIADTEKVSESVVRLQRVLRGLRPFVGELPGAPFSLPAFTGAFTEKREFRQVYAALRAYEKYDAYASPPFVPEALLNTGRMYEYYCLIRLLHAAEQNGFDTESAETFPYRDRYAADPGGLLNTYRFKRRELKLSIYYQPVIYGKAEDPGQRNGIGLFRAVALSSNEDDGDGFSPVHTGNTYTPDFLVELAAEGRRYYYIIDSKNSSFNSVKRFQVPSVVFKYMFSIAPLSDNDSAEAIVLLCGKEKTSGPESLFGIARDLRRPVKTDFLLIPLPGSTDENVYSLRDILRKACKRIS